MIAFGEYRSYVSQEGLSRWGDLLVPNRVSMAVMGSRGEPDVVMHFELRGGEPACVEIAATAADATRGLHGTDISMWNLENLAASVMRSHAEERRALPKPRGSSESLLEQVAEIYRSHPSKPVAAVQAFLGVSLRTASRRVSEAKEAGLLEPTRRADRRSQEASSDAWEDYAAAEREDRHALEDVAAEFGVDPTED